MARFSFAAHELLDRRLKRNFAVAVILPRLAFCEQGRSGLHREAFGVKPRAHLAPVQRHRDRSPGPHPLAPTALSAQSTSAGGVGANEQAGGRVHPKSPSSSSMAKCALCRQTPEVGAECPNWARSDLCGGRLETAVPAAIGISRGRTANQGFEALASPLRVPRSPTSATKSANSRRVR